MIFFLNNEGGYVSNQRIIGANAIFINAQMATWNCTDANKPAWACNGSGTSGRVCVISRADVVGVLHGATSTAGITLPRVVEDICQGKSPQNFGLLKWPWAISLRKPSNKLLFEIICYTKFRFLRHINTKRTQSVSITKISRFLLFWRKIGLMW